MSVFSGLGDDLVVPGLSGTGQQAQGLTENAMSFIQSNIGPSEFESNFLSMLQGATMGGFAPSSVDFQSAARLFRPRQTALEQMFRKQTQQSNQLATKLGRSINDPILQARLRTGFMEQQDMLESEKQAAAQNLLFQRFNLGQQALNVGNMPFQRALQAGGLGGQIMGQERQFQLGTSYTTPGFLSTVGALAGASGSVMGGIGAMKFGPKP